MKDLQNLFQSINNLNERYNLLQQKLKQNLDTRIEYLTEANAEEIGKILDNYRTRKGILNQIKTQELSRITSTKEGKLDINGAARKFVKPKNIKAGKVTFEDMDGFYKESKLEDGVLEDFRKKTEALEQKIKAQIEQQNKKFNTDKEQSRDKIKGVNKELENKKIVLNELKFKIELLTGNEIQDETLEEAIFNCNKKCEEDKKALVLAQGSSVKGAHKIALEPTPDLTFFQFLKTFDVGKSEQEVEGKKKKLEKERDEKIKKITAEFIKNRIEEVKNILHEMNNDKIFCKAEEHLNEPLPSSQLMVLEETTISVPDQKINSETMHIPDDNLFGQKNNQVLSMFQSSNIPSLPRHHSTAENDSFIPTSTSLINDERGTIEMEEIGEEIELTEKNKLSKKIINIRKNHLILLNKIFKFEDKDIILSLQEIANDKENTKKEIDKYYKNMNDSARSLIQADRLTYWLSVFSTTLKIKKPHPYRDLIVKFFGDSSYNDNTNEVVWHVIEKTINDSNKVLRNFILEKAGLKTTLLEKFITALNEEIGHFKRSDKLIKISNHLKNLEETFGTLFTKDEKLIEKDIENSLTKLKIKMSLGVLDKFKRKGLKPTIFLCIQEFFRSKNETNPQNKATIKKIRAETKALLSFFERYVRDYYPLLRSSFLKEKELYENIRNIFSEIISDLNNDPAAIKRSLPEEGVFKNDIDEPKLYKKYRRGLGSKQSDKIAQGNFINHSNSPDFTLENMETQNRQPYLLSNTFFSQKLRQEDFNNISSKAAMNLKKEENIYIKNTALNNSTGVAINDPENLFNWKF